MILILLLSDTQEKEHKTQISQPDLLGGIAGSKLGTGYIQ